nr:FCD domain-containing protein [Bradyrhizobium brasilense]
MRRHGRCREQRRVRRRRHRVPPAIYFATRNEFFWPIAQMFEITLRQSFTIAAPGSHRPRALREHRAVLDAIAAGDAETARTATVVLLTNSADDLVRIRGREFETPRPAKRR